MKEKIMKQEKGITLIALVITIIVLLILAGVAISMLSGENGILTRASGAKTETERAQKEEETNLASMELETYFITNNLKYKCAYGYVTGFDYNGQHTEETVADVEENLKKGGYEIVSKYNGTQDEKIDDKSNTYISTGMVIAKNGQEVARIVLFGDTDCNGVINATDAYTNENAKEFQKVALDIDHDGYIGEFDSSKVLKAAGDSKTANEIQNYYANKLKNKEDLVEISTIEIIKKLNIANADSIEKLTDNYTITLNEEYTYKELSNKIKNTYTDTKVKFKDNTDDHKVISSLKDEKIEQGTWLVITLADKIYENNGILQETEILIQMN